MMKSYFGALSLCIVTASFNASAAPVSVDWKTPGDGFITYDANTNLEWLDLSQTAGRPFFGNETYLFESGGIYEGFRYASRTEISGLWDSFGGSGEYTGWSAANDGLFDILAPLWGDVYCQQLGCGTPGRGSSLMYTGDAFPVIGSSLLYRYVAKMSDAEWEPLFTTQDQFEFYVDDNHQAHFSIDISSALVREAVATPIPPAAWLFGSGLLGLVGVARRKKA